MTKETKTKRDEVFISVRTTRALRLAFRQVALAKQATVEKLLNDYMQHVVERHAKKGGE